MARSDVLPAWEDLGRQIANDDAALRHHAANAAAQDLGYRIEIELDHVANIHTAFAYRVDDERDPPVGVFVCRTSRTLKEVPRTLEADGGRPVSGLP